MKIRKCIVENVYQTIYYTFVVVSTRCSHDKLNAHNHECRTREDVQGRKSKKKRGKRI